MDGWNISKWYPLARTLNVCSFYVKPEPLNASRVFYVYKRLVYTINMRAAWALQGIGYLILGTVIFLAVANSSPSQTPEAVLTSTNTNMPMNDQPLLIRSPAFQDGQPIPSKYTCDGDDISPPLALDQIPDGTVSLVLIIDDPDAPHGTWDHWVLFNIPPTVSRFGEGEIPKGVAGTNSWGTTTYGGPCPPSGEHRYVFKAFALDTSLRLPEGASKTELLENMKGHVLSTGELVGTYAKK